MMKLFCGDALSTLQSMKDATIHCCVTSPPYFGLRDYGVAGQIGLEETPDAYVARLVEVFREVKRVLRDDGTLWLNLGDSFCAPRGNTASNPGFDNKGSNGNTSLNYSGTKPWGKCKAKDLFGIPWRVAFALQDEGWYLRSDIIWHKPNPMPESVRDRPTRSHEYIFLLTKNAKYFYDHEAIKEPMKLPEAADGSRVFGGKHKQGANAKQTRTTGRTYNASPSGGRNKRSVWTVTTKPFRGAHFAVFPPDLIEPCILAGCPVGGTVLDPFCGSGTVGVVCAQRHRNFVGIDLNADYVEMARERIERGR